MSEADSQFGESLLDMLAWQDSGVDINHCGGHCMKMRHRNRKTARMINRNNRTLQQPCGVGRCKAEGESKTKVWNMVRKCMISRMFCIALVALRLFRCCYIF